jgi:predicted nucleotidyltransferase
MRPTPFAELDEVLADLVARIESILDDSFVGVYVHGSLAVGGFDAHSDVDFVVVSEDELTQDRVEALQVMHDQIYTLDSEWAKHLEGSYFPMAVLRDPSEAGTELWYLDHGARSLIRSDHCNTLVVRWTVREKGAILTGPPPDTLLPPVSDRALKSEMVETLMAWGREILCDSARFNNQFYQGFIVLSYCRMLHDIRRGYPGSKHEGAEWAKSALDASWTDLIDAAWDTRQDPARQVRQAADPAAFERTLRLVEWAMNEGRGLV